MNPNLSSYYKFELSKREAGQPVDSMFIESVEKLLTDNTKWDENWPAVYQNCIALLDECIFLSTELGLPTFKFQGKKKEIKNNDYFCDNILWISDQLDLLRNEFGLKLYFKYRDTFLNKDQT